MATKKLQNIKTIKQMIDGQHQTQTKKSVSIKSDDVTVHREVGDTWVDDVGQLWEQKNGYKVKGGKLKDIRSELKEFPNCRKKVCSCVRPGKADLKMKSIHGMCLECVTDMEHQLILDGTYKEYERKKLLENGMAWLENAKIEKDVLKKLLKSEYFNENGSSEDWGGMT
jgi:hypothetical protein